MGLPPARSGLTAPATMEMVRLRLLFSTFTAYRGETDSQQRPDRPEQSRPLGSTKEFKHSGKGEEGGRRRAERLIMAGR